MRARPNMTSTVTLLGAEAVRITSDLASRPYYYDKGPALFR
jgi:hypothetical protein